MSESEETTLIELAAEVVAAYVGNNAVSAADVPALIRGVFGALIAAQSPLSVVPAAELKPPAVPIKKSIGDDFIICLEDGRKLKSLKRHLRSAYNLTPEAYREKWGLPSDYPMVAPAYSAARSVLAKQIGLGQKVRMALPITPAPKATTGKKS